MFSKFEEIIYGSRKFENFLPQFPASVEFHSKNRFQFVSCKRYNFATRRYKTFVSRSGEHGRRRENLRTVTRRRSLSPRQSHHGDYQGGSGPHMMNPPHSKTYSNHPGNDGHYQHHMHYDSSIRRSTEDRPGTPTVSINHNIFYKLNSIMILIEN